MLASTEYTNVRLWLRLKVAAGFVAFVAQKCHLLHQEVMSAISTQAWPVSHSVILLAILHLQIHRRRKVLNSASSCTQYG